MTETTTASNPVVIDTTGIHYVLTTDGSCMRNLGPGGWGVFVQLKDGETVIRTHALAGSNGTTTNVKMKMTAVLNALAKLGEPHIPAIVVTDLKMIVDAMTLGWVEKWQAAGWWHEGKPRANNDLWDDIYSRAKVRPVQWSWVSIHNADELNEIANTLANNAALGRYRGEAKRIRATHPEWFL